MTVSIKNPDAPASDRQKKFLHGLAFSKEIDNFPSGALAWDFILRMEKSGDLTVQKASDLIDRWVKLPSKKFEPGYYSLHTPSGVIHYIHLVENRQKTGTYTKVLVGDPPKWTYDNSFKDRLHEAHKMTAEEIAHFGHITRRCLICAAELTDPDSVARGVGPVCAKRIA